MPIEASASGSSCTRTPYFDPPKTWTRDTPLVIEMRGASRVSAYSSTVYMGSVVEDRERYRTGCWAGLTF